MCASSRLSRFPLVQILFVACLWIRISNSQSEPQCTTPSRKIGVCIDIKLCPYLLNSLVTNRTKASEDYLRNSVCTELEPGSSAISVCCDRPSCATETGQAGSCIEPQMCRRAKTSLTAGTCQTAGAICCPRRTFDSYVSMKTALPEFGFCGLTAESATSRSSGSGTAATRGQHPWSALLVYRTQQQETEKCGGALISAKFVLTAAHCVDDTLVKVRLGVHNLAERCADVRAGCPFQSDVESRAIMPGYNNATLHNDLALIVLATPAPYTDHIRPICLPDKMLPQRLQRQPSLLVAGWGVTQTLSGKDLDVRSADAVQSRGDVPLRSGSVCRKAIAMWAGYLAPHLFVDVTVPKDALCAGGTFSSELCSQDSGGPLVWSPLDSSEPSVLFAVHSRHVAGCRAPVPAVYTPVLPHVEWIAKSLTAHYNIV